MPDVITSKFQEQLAIALEQLRQQKLIAFPTDTVYGVGGDPRSELVINAIFKLKARSFTQPLPVLLPELTEIYKWIDYKVLTKVAASKLFNLLTDFWPGPLTVVLKKAAHVNSLLTAGKDSVALRIPDHPVILELLKQFNAGIIGTSANISGTASAISAKDVSLAFGNELFVLNTKDQDLKVRGVESTIVAFNVETNKCIILREGAIAKTLLNPYL